MLKKGISHIEVVLAFIIFMGAIIFIVLVFHPHIAPVDDSTQLSQLVESIKKSASTQIFEIGAKTDSSEGSLSIKIPNLTLSNAGVRARDYLGNQANASAQQDGDDEIICLTASQNGEIPYFIYIELSTDITPIEGGCQTAANESAYVISNINQRKVLSEKALLDLNNSYYSDYQSLKAGLGLPAGEEFSFKVTFKDGSSIEGSKTIPKNTEIFSINKNVEALRENGGVEFASINVKIWQL